MKKLNKRLLSFVFLLIALTALLATAALAGGPLLLGDNGQPVLWPRTLTQGGPLNSQTVDAQGRVLYHVDMGDLGSISHDKAVALVDRIFGEYSNIPTSTLRFANAGPILNPNTGQPVDITSSNIGLVTSSSRPTFQNPIIFDSDGSITGGGGVLGFFNFLQVDDASNTIREGFVVLNGASVNSVGGVVPFLGVFTHEFGHLAGPLDHAQIDGAIASGSSSSAQPAGFSREQVYDLYTPFIETLYPFLFDASTRAPNSQLLGKGFGSSGFFVASLDFDTTTAMSNLYPTPEYLASRGSIEGRVVIKAGSGEIPLPGMNVIARRIDRGSYPPALGTKAFVDFPNTNLQLDADGVPLVPQAQDATDSLATAASAVTGLQFGSGNYRIGGLPPGQYMVQLQRINPSATGGSGIGPLGSQIPLPVAEEYYNGPGNSSNTPSVFVPVTVTAGNTASGIDLVINGLNLTGFTTTNEPNKHFKIRQAPLFATPVEIIGAADGANDPTQFKVTLPDGSTDPIEDFYKIEVPVGKLYFILLEPLNNASGDLDMYLFNADTVGKKKANFNDTSVVVGSSTGPTANEAIVKNLSAGTYIIGVSAFDNSNLGYRLRIIAAQ